MKNLYEIIGYYGNQNQGTILVYETNSGKKWYCVKGSCIINCTNNYIDNGTNIEELIDIDIMTSRNGIHTLNDLFDYVTN